MGRVRVVIAKDVKKDLRPNPVGLGLCLAPVAALVGTLPAMILPPGATMAASSDGAFILFGLVVGSIFALPVTAVLFPILHRAGVAGIEVPIYGAVAGLFVSAMIMMPASGALGGLVAGWLFDSTLRKTPSDRSDGATRGTTPSGNADEGQPPTPAP